MTPLELYQKAGREFGRRLKLVEQSQWLLPTPNAEWNVRTLVNHVTAEDLWVPPLMAGQSVSQVGGRFDGDVLGQNPKTAFEEAFAAASSAFAEPGGAGKTVHLSSGDVPGKDYASQLFIDHLIHAWDLAKALGVDERLDHELVAACFAELAPQAEGWRTSGAFGPAIIVPSGASPQTKLLALAGRRA
jgi:uncharacterized protein (TIGR03086 family)